MIKENEQLLLTDLGGYIFNLIVKNEKDELWAIKLNETRRNRKIAQEVWETNRTMRVWITLTRRDTDCITIHLPKGKKHVVADIKEIGLPSRHIINEHNQKVQDRKELDNLDEILNDLGISIQSEYVGSDDYHYITIKYNGKEIFHNRVTRLQDGVGA